LRQLVGTLVLFIRDIGFLRVMIFKKNFEKIDLKKYKIEYKNNFCKKKLKYA
jgi:hypothetical protein